MTEEAKQGGGCREHSRRQRRELNGETDTGPTAKSDPFPTSSGP